MKVLDISDPQVAVFFEDGKEYQYHHRILLCRIAAARWVMLTPDLEFVVHNFGEECIVVFGRSQDFPDEVRFSCYAFDPLDAYALASFRRRVKLHAAISGESTELQCPTFVLWILADQLDARFGETVRASALDLPEGFVSIGDHSVVRSDGEAKFVERVTSADIAEYVLRRRSSTSDARTLGFHMDPGDRSWTFAALPR